MRIQYSTAAVVLAVFSAVGVQAIAAAPAAAECLPASECDAIKQQLRDFREFAKPLREEARELRREARQLRRGSDERKALRREARQLKRELRKERRESQVRRLVHDFRSGCRGC